MKFLLSVLTVLPSIFLAVSGTAETTPASTVVGTLPTERCVYRPTQTVLARKGCPIECPNVVQCAADYAVRLECGCKDMRVEPRTVTVCPTDPECVECTTAWGVAKVPPTTCGPLYKTPPTGTPVPQIKKDTSFHA